MTEARRPRVLALPRYGRRGASSRLRVWQYLPWLEAAGLDVQVRALLPDFYIADLQQGRRNPARLALAYARQIAGVVRAAPPDLLWIEKEVLPWVPGWLEQATLARGVPRVIDYDDAVYQVYEEHRSPLVRALLKSKHEVAMHGAALVVAGNSTLAERARRANAPRVEILPTVIDLDRYPPRFDRGPPDGPPSVCWIGQQSTAGYLLPLAEVFDRLAKSGRARFVAIGIDATALGLPMSSLPWSEDDEVNSISVCDIGIMPLSDGSFERGKCGYKLIQYMACGLPVVASPVGVNREIVNDGVNGFLAQTPEEWERAITRLANDPALRARMGQAGREQVEQRYTIQKKGPVLAALLRSVLRG